jgi:hypothetical protein
MQDFSVNRELPEGRYKLTEVFSGLDHVEPLIKCVGNRSLLRRIIEETEVTLTVEDGYMYVDDGDGSLVVGLEYFRTAEPNYLYLDVIHELVHVKQYREGKELFDGSYSYVDRPTEIEAYRCAVEESRNIGMTDDAIADYVYVEWITNKQYEHLLNILGVQSKPHEHPPSN